MSVTAIPKLGGRATAVARTPQKTAARKTGKETPQKTAKKVMAKNGKHAKNGKGASATKKKVVATNPKKKSKGAGSKAATAKSWPPTFAQVMRTKERPSVEDVMMRLQRTAARVGVSSVSGVGLIAVRPIQKGERLFEGMQKDFHDEFGDFIVEVPVSKIAEMEKKPGLEGIGHMVRAYMESYEDRGKEWYGMVWRGMDSLCPMWFLNDGGNEHNVRYLEGDEEDGIVAVRDIAVGEELLGNYDVFSVGNDSEVKEYPNDAAWVDAKEKAVHLRGIAAEAQRAAAEAQKFLDFAETALSEAGRAAAKL